MNGMAWWLAIILGLCFGRLMCRGEVGRADTGLGLTGALGFGGMPGLCGYVLLPLHHPWRELDLQGFEGPDIGAPGGVTFGPHLTGWIGFDTAHAGDVWPLEELQALRAGGDVPDEVWEEWETLWRVVGSADLAAGLPWRRVWTMESVKAEVESLAREVVS